MSDRYAAILQPHTAHRKGIDNMAQKSYHEQIDIENTQHLREILKDLPPYTKDFFRGITPRTQSRTRIAYAYDLTVFFQYLHENNPVLAKKEIREISLEDLESLSPSDIEEYLDYLQFYNDHTNKELGQKRKLASLKSFYKYFIYLEAIKYNPAELVKMPKVHERPITRLDVDEVAQLLDHVESGEQLTARQQAYHQRTRLRDLALMSLMLGTGIRVSECVGLNVEDVDFKNDAIRVHRKGGKETMVYFGDEVELTLLNYLEEREELLGTDSSEPALFLSIQKKRISVRAVENLVKKYSHTVTTVKHITPHKLRSTYGTSLYRETGDIYLVADVLGHSDVNTTKKHYAAIEEERRRGARNVVRLRESTEE